MELKELNQRPSPLQDNKANLAFRQFEKLRSEVQHRALSEEVKEAINQEIEQINQHTGSEKQLLKLCRTAQTKLLRMLEKQHKLVSKHHYRTTWMMLGMGAFGVPLGVAFGLSLKNMGLMGVGIPIGMVIGMSMGANMDKKALAEGRQLDLEV